MSEEVKEKEKEVSQVHSVYLTGPIGPDMFTSFVSWLAPIRDPDCMFIELDSNGGDPETVNTMIDMLVARSRPNVIIATARCCSATVGMMGMARGARLAYPSTVWMQHLATMTLPKCFLGEHHSVISSTQDRQDLFQSRIKRRSGMTDEEMSMLFGPRDLYFNSVDALMMGEHGLIDGIIYRELSFCKWIILTRQGFKTYTFPFSNIKDLPVMTDEELAPYDLKSWVPNQVVSAFERLKKIEQQ